MAEMKSVELKFVPHMGQSQVLRSDARFKVLACGRRWGKTFFAWMMLLISALKKPGIYWWVAPLYKELTPVTRIINGRTPLELIFKRTEDQGVIRYLKLVNGSEIRFHSADRADSLRGEGLDGLVIDEAALVKKERWERELRPSLIDKKGWAIFISTPKGRNWFHTLYLRGQDNSAWPDWRSWRQKSYINTIGRGGYLDSAEIDAVKRELSELVFQQEIMAEFVEGEGTLFRRVDDALAGALGPGESKRRYSLGVDLAKHRDFTVLTAIDDLGHLRGFERFRHLDWCFQKEKIKSFMGQYPGVMLLDCTGVGDPIYDYLKREDLRVKGYRLTAESKRKLIENLIIGFSENRWTIPDDPKVEPLLNELKAFTHELTPTGSIRYRAPEGMHDDCVISFALAAWGYESPRGSWPVSYVFQPPQLDVDWVLTSLRRPQY